MMHVGFPGGTIVIVGLIAPRRPSFTRAARKQLEIRAGAAGLDDFVLLVGLARVLALARRQEIYLSATRRQGARVLAAHAEQDELGYVAEIEADAAPIGAAILAHLVPNDVGLVGEAPGFHDR